MSGGHYYYAYSQMNQLAMDLHGDCERYAGVTKNDWGEVEAMPSDILTHMKWVADRIDELAEAAHDIEWLMSGDYGNDTLRERCESWKLTEHLRA